MCQLAHPFYGLTLTPEDKVRIHKEIFHLIYNSNGGFTHDEIYSMPVYLRYFYFNMLIEQKRAEIEQSKSSENGNSDMTSKVKGPPKVSKPF